jgi:hypothetical protein
MEETNAGTDNQRTDAPDADRALRSRSADQRRAADIPGRLTGAIQCAHDPAEYPIPAGPAGFLAVRRTERPRMRGLSARASEARKPVLSDDETRLIYLSSRLGLAQTKAALP